MQNSSVTIPDFKNKIVSIENTIMQGISDGTLVSKKKICIYRHFFIPGGYGREMTAPAGLLLIGKIHKYPCINIISKGRIAVATEDGTQEIVAPFTFVSPAGVKRAGVTIEDTVWTTFHVTDETDIDKVEDAIAVETYEEYTALENIKLKELT